MGIFDAVGDFVGDLFGHGGGGSNPAEAGTPYYNQAKEAIGEGYNKYIGQGDEAYKVLSDIFKQYTSNPEEVINKIMGNYKPSEGYQYKLNQGLNTARNAAAAGGYVGNPDDIGHQVDIEGRLMSDDMQQWLNNVLGIKNQGIAGQGEFYNKGYQASTGKASDLANIFGTEATNAISGAREQKTQQQKLFDALIGLTGLGGGGGFGGGAFSGGGGGGSGGTGNAGGGISPEMLAMFL